MKQIYEKKPDCSCSRCKALKRGRKPGCKKLLKVIDRLELQINRLLKGEDYDERI